MKSLINFKASLKTKCHTWENFIVSQNLLYLDSFLQKTHSSMFLLVSGGHICAPERNTNMVSPYKAL